MFSIRLRDENNNWGPRHKRTVYLGGNPRYKITSGEYYWDNGTPVTLLVFDGNYDEAIETVYHTSSSLSLTGTFVFSIRLRDENNNWGPTYKRTVYLGGNPRDIKITSGEYYWDKFWNSSNITSCV